MWMQDVHLYLYIVAWLLLLKYRLLILLPALETKTNAARRLLCSGRNMKGLRFEQRCHLVPQKFNI